MDEAERYSGIEAISQAYRNEIQRNPKRGLTGLFAVPLLSKMPRKMLIFLKHETANRQLEHLIKPNFAHS